MKNNIKYIVALAAVAVCASACDVAQINEEDSILYTTSPSSLDASTVYSNYELAEGTIFSIAEIFCETNSYRGRFLPWYGLNSDIEWYNTYNPGDGKYDIAAYDCTVENSQMNTASNGATNNPWALMYTGIERANLAIEGIRKYGKDNNSLKYLLGEALTLRAMIYYDLIKAWGDVPARFASTTPGTIYVAKSNRDIIYNQILSDLEEAFNYLPWPGVTSVTSRTDRINLAFAKGLYARIALAASGYALRTVDGEEGKKGAYEIRLTNDPNLKSAVLYPKALKYLKEVINSGTCSLETDYQAMWYNLNNMNNLKAGPAYETLYVIPFGSGRGRWNFTFAVKSDNSSYSGGVSRGGDAGPLPTMFYRYGDDDVRRGVTCVNYKWLKDDSAEPAGIANWYFGKYRFEWMDAQPYTGGNDDGVKPVVMRYADILLMAAEIENDLNGPANAKQYLEAVRARACGEDAAHDYVEAIASPQAFFEAVKEERALEFCGEFLRKGDLIRWNCLKSSLDGAIQDMKNLREGLDKYSFLEKRTDIYYKDGEDGESLVIWGLSKSEVGKPDGDWTKVSGYLGAKSYDDAKSTGFHLAKIVGLYKNDPETYMYWPVFKCNIVDSQNTLANDYKY